MVGILSSSTGVILFQNEIDSRYIIFDIVSGVEKENSELQYLYSSSQDWVELEGSNETEIISNAKQEYWIERAVSYLRIAINGLEESLKKRAIEHVDEIITLHGISKNILNRLLVAPLKDNTDITALASFALCYGFSAVASILDELSDLQAPLRRFVDSWLNLPKEIFIDLHEQKELIWTTAVDKCGMMELLTAGTKQNFIYKWNLLVFEIEFPQSRLIVPSIGKKLSNELFPHEEQDEKEIDPLIEDEKFVTNGNLKTTLTPHEALTKVSKQVNAIAESVSQGYDNRARKYLRELLKEQISAPDGVGYAVKSLCNIAQKCADMFRMDFELICLKKALELNSFDQWTKIQYGDHKKRTGDYSEALKIFKEAEKLGESEILISSIADVYSQQGEYDIAIDSYKRINNYDENPQVLTAIADNLRKMGKFKEALEIYEMLINYTKQGSDERAYIGIAEIAKVSGNLENALQIYNEILERNDIGNKDKQFYRLGLCNVLKLMEKYEDAFSVADKIVHDYPFSMEARFFRGSICGLIGKENEGLIDLPENTNKQSWREWLRPFYRGLLLLKLKRYEDAKKNLVGELSKAIVSGEEKNILRMATALYFLKNNDLSEVDRILSKIPDLHNCHANYLSLVLKLHLAKQKKDHVMLKKLNDIINKLEIKDTKLDNAVEEINKGNFNHALSYEIDTLLKLAA